MPTNPFILGKGGISQILGSASSLAMAAPLVDGSRAAEAMTDPTRIGYYYDRTTGLEKFSLVVMGQGILDAYADSLKINGNVGVGGAASSPSTALNLPAATTGRSSLRLAHGVAPSAPVDGDMWTTTAGVFVRVNGITQQLEATSGAGTVTSVGLSSSNLTVGGVNPVTTSGVISVNLPAVIAGAGPVGDASHVAQITFDNFGRLTAVTSVAIAISAGAVSGLGGWATKTYPTDAAGLLRNNGSGTLSWDNTTYLTANQTITLSGDVGGSGTTAITTTIGAGKVTLAMQANLAANSIIGNNTGSAATPIALTQVQVTAMINAFSSSLSGAVPASGGGTTNFLRADGTWTTPATSGGTVTSVGLSSSNLTVGGTNPVTTSGVISVNLPAVIAGAGPVGDASHVAQITFDNFGRLTAVTSVAIASQTITLGTDLSGSGTTTLNATIVAGAVTLAKMANLGANTIIGSIAGGVPAALTTTQVTTLVNAFTSSLSGAAPASGGGTTNYLRADGTWASPPGATSGTVTSVGVSSSGSITVGGSPITTSGVITINLPVTITGAGPVGGAATVPVITFDNFGRLTAVTTASITPGSIGAIPASGGTNGYLTTWTGTSTLGASQYLPAGNFPALTGDVTTVAGALATTLANVISAAGPIGDASHVAQITYDAKGRLTAVTTATITPSAIGAIGGSIASGQVAYGSGTNTIQGSASLTYAGGLLAVSANAGAIPAALTGSTVQLAGVDASTSPTRILLDAFTASAGNTITGRRARGIAATPSAVASGDILLSFTGYGFGTTIYSAVSRARIQLNATETWTDSANGTEINFSITPNGGTATYIAANLANDGSFTLRNGTNVGIALAPQGGAANFIGTLTTALLSARRTYTLPDVSGTVTFGTGTASYLATWSNANTVTGSQYLPDANFPALTGDVMTVAGALATTLASVIAAGGPTGSASVVPIITYDAKGRLTAVTTANITAASVGAIGGTVAANQVAVGSGTNTISGSSSLTFSAAGTLVLTGVAQTSGVRSVLRVNGAVDTGVTASTEQQDITLSLNHVVTWATSTPTSNRCISISAPTYACDTAGQTIGTASTIYISGPPIAGTNVSITNGYAILINSGNVSMSSGNLSVAGTGSFTPAATTGTVSTALRVAPGNLTTATASTEINDVSFSLTHTVQWATSTPSTNRTFWIRASTLSCDTVGQTITTAATFTVSGAPVAGTNVSITNAYAVWVQAGISRFEGDIVANANLVVGTAALSTSATTGFFYAPTSAGAPTGVPGGFTGAVAMEFNTSANVLYVYNGGWLQIPTLGGSGTSRIPFLSGTNGALTCATGFTYTASGGLVITPQTSSSGANGALTVTTVANTSQTTATEINAINFNLSATRTWAAGAITTQREFLIQAPTWAFASASTITTGATFAISGAPVAGTNATITTPLALWVQGGSSRFAGAVTVTGLLSLASGTSIGNSSALTTPPLAVVQGAASSGAVSVMTVTSGASTNQTASTEVNAANFNFSATRTWATGDFTTQREFLIQAPTYAFAGASTITKAATFAISGGPTAGTNATISNNYALWVQSGNTQFDGQVVVANAFISQRAATIGNSVSPGALIPLTVTQTASNTGAIGVMLMTSATMTGQTASTEVNAVNFNFSATRTWAAGAISIQREVWIQAPTYAFASASTISTGATFAISGAPTAGTNATISAPLALWVQAGNSQFDGGTLTTTGGMRCFNSGAATRVPLQVTLTNIGSGSVSTMTVTPGVTTGQTASTEVIAVDYNLVASRTWANGNITTQREFRIVAPTYAFASTPNTITNAATFAITGAPVAGTNATLTNSWALWVQGGSSLFAGNLMVGGGLADSSISSSSWITAGSQTVGANVWNVLNTNTSTIALYTLTMPAAPNQGQKIRIATAGTVTAMTISANSGQSINGALSGAAFNANTSVEFIYSGTTWYRLL